MARSSERQYVNDERTLVGNGNTQDLALNEKLQSARKQDQMRLLEREHRKDSLGALVGVLAFWNSSAGTPESTIETTPIMRICLTQTNSQRRNASIHQVVIIHAKIADIMADAVYGRHQGPTHN